MERAVFFESGNAFSRQRRGIPLSLILGKQGKGISPYFNGIERGILHSPS
jgi:hypothetical protein